jgi:hypothetical protein
MPATLGYVKNFEQAIRQAGCEFIALSDQDDIWEPRQARSAVLRIFDADTGIVFSNAPAGGRTCGQPGPHLVGIGPP